MDVELLACPFCGEPGDLIELVSGAYRAHCGGGSILCPANPGGMYCDRRDDAIAAWNRRAPAQPPTPPPVHNLSNDPGASIAGRVNAALATIYGSDESRVKPFYRLSASRFDRMRLANALFYRLKLDRAISEGEYMAWDNAGDVAAYVEARVGAGATK